MCWGNDVDNSGVAALGDDIGAVVQRYMYLYGRIGVIRTLRGNMIPIHWS